MDPLSLLLSEVDNKNMRDLIIDFDYHVRAQGLTDKTRQCYIERLMRFCKYSKQKGKDFGRVDKAVIQSYVFYLQDQGVKNISINGYLKVLKIFYRYLHSENLIKQNPAAAVPLLRTERVIKPILSEAEIHKVISAASKNNLLGLRNLCMFLFMYDTGCRVSELTGLKLSDIDIEHGTGIVYGKGRRERVITFGLMTAKYLHRWLTKYRNGIIGERFFCTPQGRELDRHNVRKCMLRLGRKAGVHLSPHKIRHTAASHRAMNGMPGFLLQRFLGHSSIQTTQQYINLADNDKVNEAIRHFSLLDAMGRKK